MSDGPHIPVTEILKGVPGIVGIRLEGEPRYVVVETLTQGAEVRRYAPALVAEITLAGEHDAVLNAAFTRLAKYIFGDNDRSAKMAMTTPVAHRPAPSTTPVMQTPDSRGWTVTFFLSNSLRPDQAPQPHDSAISLVQVPERLLGAVRYNGNNTEPRRMQGRDNLLTALASSRFAVQSDVFWAQYDAPFVIPFLKRNEALVEVVEQSR